MLFRSPDNCSDDIKYKIIEELNDMSRLVNIICSGFVLRTSYTKYVSKENNSTVHNFVSLKEVTKLFRFPGRETHFSHLLEKY